MPRAKKETAKFLQILEYFDGPQAIILDKSADSKLVAVAIDRDGFHNPFFAANISYDQWERYRRGYVDFRSLFVFPRWREWYIIEFLDFDPSNIVDLTKISKDEINEEDVPAAGFFAYDHSEPILSEVSSSLATQQYATDGIWALPDFTQFYNKLNDLYCFFISLKLYVSDVTNVDRKQKIKDAFRGHPLRGGSSYNNLYTDLAHVQTFDERIAIGKLKYASPGEVDVKGRFDVFGEIAVAHNELSINYDSLKAQYNAIYKYLSENKLLKTDKEYFDPDGASAKYLLTISQKFASDLHVSDSTVILDLTEGNALIYAKILLSYFRRLERYFMFFAEGRVKDPELRKGVSPK